MPRQTWNCRQSIKKTLDYLRGKTAADPNLKVFFFDEARFGLQTSLTRIWAKSGEPLQVKVKQAYQNFYIYGSVDPRNGENFFWFLPWVNTESMNFYLEQLSLAYPNDRLVMIMDQAGWHKSAGLIVPDNIEIIYLPPYSPELNPIERLWKHLKNSHIHNRVFNSLQHMLMHMVEAFQSLKDDTVASLCRCSYLVL